MKWLNQDILNHLKSENGFSDDMVLEGVIMNIAKLPKLNHLSMDVR